MRLPRSVPVQTAQNRRVCRVAPTGIMRKIRPTSVGGCIPHRTGAMQNSAIGLRRTHLTRTWVNGRYDARSVDDPGYTDTVREDFDRIADLSEAEGWDRRRGVMGPRPGCR